LIEISEKYKIKKFIYISSSSIWTNSYKNKVVEKTPYSPSEIYGRSKMQAEKDLVNSEVKYWTIFRVPLIVSENRLGILSILFDLIKNNKKIFLIGNGKNKLNFCHLYDLTKFISLSIKKKEKEIYNLASNDSITLNNLFKSLINFAKSQSKIVFLPDLFISKILIFLNYLKLSPLSIYHIKMIKNSLVFDISKI